MMKPRIITFTGADADTPIAGMQELAARHRVEWGILFSRRHQGSGRFPPHAFIEALQDRGLRLCAHLCDDYAQALVETGSVPGIEPFLHGIFQRVQVNAPEAADRTGVIATWARGLRLEPIVPCAGDFPADDAVSWLFQPADGGDGVPGSWPPAPARARGMVGYAGGIGPHTARKVLSDIDASAPYWLDIGDGVRTRDRLDLDLCRRVCRAVFG